MKNLVFCEFSPHFQSENGFELKKMNRNEEFPSLRRTSILPVGVVKYDTKSFKKYLSTSKALVADNENLQHD